MSRLWIAAALLLTFTIGCKQRNVAGSSTASTQTPVLLDNGARDEGSLRLELYGRNLHFTFEQDKQTYTLRGKTEAEVLHNAGPLTVRENQKKELCVFIAKDLFDRYRDEALMIVGDSNRFRYSTGDSETEYSTRINRADHRQIFMNRVLAISPRSFDVFESGGLSMEFLPEDFNNTSWKGQQTAVAMARGLFPGDVMLQKWVFNRLVTRVYKNGRPC